MIRQELVVIDPQVDFCDPNGNLYVGGADKDSINLAVFIDKMGKSLHDIHVTLDTHHLFDISHPIFWVDEYGKHPNVFTIISYNDVKDGVWKPSIKSLLPKALKYVETLNQNQRYPLCIWPPHCLIGTAGHNVVEPVQKALLNWETNEISMVDYVTKGSNFMTEHYSAVQADVPDSSDPSTQLNTKLIEILKEAETIFIAGEALSHCVANTVRDIANNFGEENVKKMVLLTNATSNVTGFEQMGVDFIAEMRGRGMQLALTTDF